MTDYCNTEIFQIWNYYKLLQYRNILRYIFRAKFSIREVFLLKNLQRKDIFNANFTREKYLQYKVYDIKIPLM